MKINELVVNKKYKIRPEGEFTIATYIGIDEVKNDRFPRLRFICNVSKQSWYYPFSENVPAEDPSSLELELW